MSDSISNGSTADSASPRTTANTAEDSTSGIDFGSVLAEERERRGITVTRLSRLMGMDTPGLLTRWEGGIRVPTEKSIDKIAEVLEPKDDRRYVAVRSRLRVAAGLLPAEIDRASLDAHMHVFALATAMEELDGPEREFVEDVAAAANRLLGHKIGARQ